MDEKVLRTKVQELIDKFERVKAQGKYKSYNEENTKKDFILPLFRALGWNVDDSEEVKAEEKVSKKRVDYAFRINGVVKFYLEAKPLREYLTEPKYAKQAIEYAWNKSVTWAILCNFEGIRVFNAEWKWDEKRPTRNSFLDLRYTDFLGSSFQYLTWLSKESFEQGILNKNAATLGKKTKKLPIDKQLLADFTDYRNILTKDILKHNQSKTLSEDDLDEIVQRILDRLIFIRTCEDKEIESEKLESLVRMYSETEGKLYKELNKKFREYDDGYNSKLFREHLCEDVIISNDALKQVILGTYQTRDLSVAYDFSAIGADVLGNIYEQYLGHILKKTSQRAKLTNGKAHRKEQGIYYTPTYIVDYIVRNTVGEKLKQRKVKVDELKILDPACGSGSFLLKAFDAICEHEIKKEGKTLQTKFEDVSGGKLLKRKTELLKNCIFGVDLDPQAVEIAQLNLLLKLAEKRHRLPTLQENVKCGNSLIDDPAVAGDRTFGWEERFSDIIQYDDKGNLKDEYGFDIVIGNPPYFNIETMSPDEKKFLAKYECYSGKSDILYYFYNKGISLLKPNGILGFITSRYFIEATHASNLRKYLLENCEILQILDLSNLPVFKDVGIHTVILIIKKKNGKKQKNSKIFYKDIPTIEQLKNSEGTLIEQNNLNENGWALGTRENLDLFKKLESDKSVLLKNISIIEQGQKTGLNHAFTVTENIIQKNKLEKKFIRKLVKNSYIEPYFIEDRGLFLIYASDEMNQENAPNIISYLQEFKEQLKARAEACDGLYPWYRLQRPRSKELFDAKEKIVVPYRAPKNKFGYDDQQRYNDGGDVRIIVIKTMEFQTKYILAILNSKLMNFYYSFIGRKKGSIFEYFVEPLQKIPIKKINVNDQKPFIKLTEKMLSFNKRLNEIGDKKTDERARIEDEIKKIDAEIDQLVYKLYGLTKEEIAIVEESLK